MKIKIENIYNIIFLISYFFLLLYSFVGANAGIHNILSRISNISLMLVAVSFLFQLKRFKKKNLLILLFISLLSIILLYNSEDFLFVKLVLLIVLTNKIPFDKRIKIDLKIRIILILIVYLLFINNKITDITYVSNSGLLRHSYGFTNPNVLALHSLILCFEILYLNRNSKSKLPMLITLLITVITYYITYSRSTLIAFLSFVILKILTDKHKNLLNSPIVKKIIINIPFITFVLVFIFFILFYNNNQIGIKLNELMSGRLYNIKYYYENFSITLFGQNLSLTLRTLDTAPVYFLYSFGIFGLIIYIVGYRELLKTLYKKRLYSLVLIFLVFVIYGLSERLWTAIDYNIFISAFTFVFFDNTLDVNEK